ncbi:non-ribosomal peptide synthase domain TIGR01720/amino acid adenylation domain-containing protein [Micromonospora matsumotoense]|uniref:Non-ribosomal peptide synthase domain TIGR01720/amino acid adenylation domain-containing protein n=1 Tax=Micromonospora matsumotoense TaxID=121616 RepID=A0A1C5AV43_9ACTN|nr:non-ribosomal peptide synthetase [Micromonospora matsumotoense]SCF49033.1 non-ribosomal peptide synthase domain TIGR01720/amino acid adenylation domain-containing protein [Micromonospora matsumotoense]
MTKKTGLEDVLPLSPLQEGLLFHALYDTDAADVYTVSTALELTGPLDTVRLRDAGQALLDRHANLRAGFRRTAKGTTVAAIPTRARLPWAEHDLSGLPETGRIAELDRLAVADQRRRFDMARPPLLRMTLTRLGTDVHRLTITHHHILLDGWSAPLLVRELLDLYARPGSLPPVTPYKAYLAWLARWDRDAATAAWREALAGLDEPTRMAPAGTTPEPVVPGSVETALPAELSGRLTDLARSLGVTLNTVVQTAWGLLLARLTGRDDVVFGATVSGRPPQLPGVESMIGLFINTVPVRVRVDPAEPAGDLLVRVQDEQAALMEHQYLGLADIQRLAGHGELFDTLTVFESYPDDPDAAEPVPGLRVTGTQDEDATHYPLVLVAEPGPRINLEIRHRADVFDADAARTILDRLIRVVTAIAADPAAPVGRIDILDPAERAAVLTEWNGSTDGIVATTFPRRFADMVAAYPENIAVICEDEQVSYAELAARADRLARALAARGVGPGQVVAVALPRSVDLVTALVGVLRSGAAYLALDLDYPADRLRYMLADAAPTCVVSRADLANALPGDRPVVDVAASGPDVTPIAPAVADAAYVIYTSGSTGRPKGVVVTHEGVAKLLATQQRRLGVTHTSRVLFFASPSFDLAYWELCQALLSGGALVVVPTELRVPGAPLVDYLTKHEVTQLALPPSVLSALPADCRLPLGVSMLVGTEEVPARLAERFAAGRRMFNAYGPTETSVNATLWECTPVSTGTVPIGYPDPGQLAYVLDSGLNPAPPGVVGELYLGGLGLARGYHHRPGLTAERFLPDPFAAPGDRMYRTGDLVRWTPDGALEFVGRVDHQVKIRGFRVELGEIEAVVARQEGVRQAAVVLRTDGGVKRIVAYVVGDTDLGRLRTGVAATLPDYMVPGAFVALERLPVSVNGKLDRAALPAPEFTADGGGRTPRTPREKLLCDVFAEVLGVPTVGIDDDFFALGGDSIMSMQLAGRARVAGLVVSPRQVFHQRTPARLVAVAGTVTGVDAVPSSLSLVALTEADRRELAGLGVDVREVLPLSPLQTGLLFHSLLDDVGPDVYTVRMVVDLTGPIDATRLRAAGQALLDRQASLRASFHHLASGTAVSVVPATVTVPWTEVDLSGLDADASQDAWQRLLAEQGRRFDPTTAPLLRLALVRTGANSHRLVLTHHHLLLDGWSRGPLLAELSALYRDGDTVPPAGRPFRDYLAWLAGQDRRTAEHAWAAALDGLAEPTRVVPVDGHRAALAPEVAQVELPEDRTAALTAGARARGLTVNTVVQAAWGLLLARLTGRDDVVFGAVVSGRPPQLPGVESMIGLFINTVPVRVRIDPAEPAGDLLARLQDEQAALMEHQYLSLADIQRIGGHGELFDTLLVFENYPDGDADDDGLPVTGTDGHDATHYPLTLIAEPGPRLHLAVEYRPDLFDSGYATRLAEALVTVVDGLVDGLDAPVGRVGLLDRAGRAAILAAGTGEVRELPGATLPELVAAQVAATPDAVALVGPDGVGVTYRELDARSERLARVLAAVGVGPETVVALALPRSVELVVAILAAGRAGAAYLPLDLDHPDARLATMLADARPVAVLAVGDTAPRVAGLPHGAAPIVLDGPLDDPQVRLSPPGPQHPAYVIYTSGSTGAPKGVEVAHAGIVNRLRWMQHEYALGAGDRVLQKTPAGFDVSVWEFFWPLVTGATLVVARPDGHRDPGYLAELIQRERITTVHFVPSMLAAFLAAPGAAGCPTLRRVLCSGEALPSVLADRCREVLPGAALHNLYGPTEASVDVTAWPAERGTGTGTVPIGGPVWNTRVSVLDAALRPVPVGVPGELYLSGVQLARGYRGRPDLTAGRFVADPYGPAGTRMYRTGDQVRWTAPGVLDFLGRGDGQVKIRGLRVELGEIEAALAGQPDVGTAVVLLREDRPGVAHLVAYLTVTGALDTAALRVRLAALLPDYMVPAAFVVLDALPVSVNGKLDRAALPAPDFAGAGTGTAPRNPREQLLVELFARVLAVPTVGVEDDFFSLGGDSIISIQLVGRARAAGLSLSLRQVFQLRTPAALAAAAESAFVTTTGSGALVTLTDEETAEVAGLGLEVAEVLPLAPLQTGLLFHAAFDADGLDLYTVQIVFDLPGGVDPARLRAAGQALLQRHANLRTSFHQLDSGRPVAVVNRGVTLPWAEADLSDLDDDRREEAWQRCLAEEGRRFDPAVAPLLRMMLVRTGDAYRLVLTHQHMLLDGWSRGPLMDQLSALYEAADGGTAPTPYRDFLAWLAGQDRPAAEQAWRAALAGVSDATRLAPADPQRAPAVPELVEQELTEAVTARLTSLARSRGLTLNTLVQAAWSIVLGRLTGRDDVVFGVTVSGRPAQVPGVESMIGLFINTLPVRVRIDPAEPVAGLLTRLQDEQSALLDHQYLGLADIQRLAGVGELFDTLLIVENYPERSGDGPESLLAAVDAGGRDATHYPLTWVVDPGQRLRVGLEFRTDLFAPPVARRLVGALTAVLTAFTTDPGRAVGRLDLVSDEDRTGWNPPPPASVDDPTVAALFERQVAESPDAPAVVCGAVRWTFAALNDRANRLARLLASRGVGAEDVVALALPRTADAITAILAVLKCGAAYLPLDPAYPPARVAAMLADARPAVLVTAAGVGVTADETDHVLVDDPTLSTFAGHDLTDGDRVRPARPQHPAYVIYTSGSTGRPKGVVVTHRNLVNLFRSHRAQLHLPARAATGRRHLRVGHAWSFAFDASWQPQLWLLDGHALHIVTEERQRDPEQLAALIRAEGIDFIELTPSHFAQLADAGLIRDGRCPLAVVGVGGEAVPPALWQRLGALPGTEAFNLYGPTEATVDALAARIGDTASPVIGRAVAGARAYVLDRALRHTPTGVAGELYVAGAGLARGYLGRPDQTAERFLADPYGAPGERMYRTGDLVRWTEDGRVEYLGRVDEQVKIRGFRVELGEIESVLAAQPGVAEAVVAAREDRPGVRLLAGYVVGAEGLDLTALRAAVAAELPDYMVPSTLLRLDRLPTLANGKLDRAALPAPDLGAAGGGRAPRSDRERVLGEVVAAVLGLPSVDVEADFFALGGDSIVAMQLVGRARAAGLRLTPRQVFAERTVAGLALAATAVDRTGGRAADGVGSFPLTPVMRWLREVDGPIDGFNQSAVVQVPAGLGWEPLLVALQAVTDRHDLLRARLDRTGDWSVTVPPPGSSRAADWTVRVDVTGLDERGLWDTVVAQADIAQAGLDPERGAMIRAAWLDAGPHRPGRLLLLVHHLVVDGVSWRVLLPEIGAAWRDAVAGRTPLTAATGTSFRRWATGLAERASDPARVAELPRWEQIVGRGDPLPVRRPLDPTLDVAGTLRDITLTLPTDVTEALLTRVPAGLGAGVNDVLLGALGMAVTRWRAGQGDAGDAVLVALEGHGREEHLVDGADLSGTVGWFTSIFPVCLDTAGIDVSGGGAAVAEAVVRVREHLAELPDNGMGYGMLRYLNPVTAPTLAALPHPPIQFNYMGRFDFPEAADWEFAPEAEAAENGADDAMPETYELVLNAQTEDRASGPQLVATWSWPDGVFAEESVDELARLWFDALQALVTHNPMRSIR